ncbi:MAG: LysR substrate-binding domain-containing protein [Burkholderiaceae bacterium]|nr:LysR substrate-binding domain-containing protein [Burkholderiaceae bacterium]
MSLHFDLVDLRLLVRIAEAESLTGGAAAMHLSLPAASARVKHLEERIGAKLLHRSSQGVELTAPGLAFVQHARTVLAQLEHLRADLQEYAKGVKGHLRLFANTTASSEFLPQVLRTYLIRHPDVNVDLRERSSDEIVRAVLDGQTDLGIVAGTVRTGRLETIPYREDRLALVVAEGHPLADEASVDFVRVLDFDQIGLHEASAIHTFVSRICDDLHRVPRFRIQVGNFESACRMIEAGIGVGILPASAATRHARTMAIRIVPLRDDWAIRRLVICARSLASLPSFALDLIELLEDDARRAVATSPAGEPRK